MNQGILIIIILIVLLLCYAAWQQNADSFADLIPDLAKGQQRFNPFASLVNIINPQIPFSKEANQQVQQATVTVNLEGGKPGEYQQAAPTLENQIPEQSPESITIAQTICEVVKADSFDGTLCSNFDRPDFAKNCGISFDLKSTNSKGQVQGLGGLYLSPLFKKEQADAANNKVASEYIYNPTFGKTAPGTFAADKFTCEKLGEEIACQKKKSFDSPNCVQCFSTSEFHRIDPTTEITSPSIVVLTNAHVIKLTFIPTVIEGFASAPVPQDKNVKIMRVPAPDNERTKGGKPFFIDLPDLKEGMTFTIETMRETIVNTFVDFTAPVNPPPVNPPPVNPPLKPFQPSSVFDDSDVTSETLYIAGFLTGQTRNGKYNIDIKYLMYQPTYTPRYLGMTDITFKENTVRCWMIRPEISKDTLKVTLLLPFSFSAISSNDSQKCETGPFITKSISAKFLNSDPCHSTTTSPGSFSSECLIPIFIGLGGSPEGEGYPENSNKAKPILFDKTNKPRTLIEIGNFLTEMSLIASTGLRNGESIPIEEWDAASKFMTGVPIKGPCDGPNKEKGPLSDACIKSLYLSPTTYSLNGSEYTTKAKDGTSLYCNFEGRLSPTTPAGLAMARSKGGVTNVANFFNAAHTRANDNTLRNTERRGAVMDCYGIQLWHQKPEVFLVLLKGMTAQNGYTRDQADNVCKKFGKDYAVATNEQLRMAELNGAAWTSYGWTATSKTPVILDGSAATTNRGGVYCYGNKPEPDEARIPSDVVVIAFNASVGNWSNPASD